MDSPLIANPMEIAEGKECLPSPKWLRGFFNGRLMVDSRQAMLLRANSHPPTYYFPKDDVEMSNLKINSEEDGYCYWDMEVGGQRRSRAAREYLEAAVNYPLLAGYISFEWSAMDAWFEEDEEVYVHARDPRVRIDTLSSSRHIKIMVMGETVAESHRPVLLFETGLPVCYYLPKTDVRLDLLESADRLTRCPYKGEAHYYTVRVGERKAENIAWYYRYPTSEAARIASLIAFYTEKVEAVYIDGIRMK